MEGHKGEVLVSYDVGLVRGRIRRELRGVKRDQRTGEETRVGIRPE